MRILKRMLDFIASRMLMVTVACALLIISFYLAMNTANIWVLIDDGLDARASVVLASVIWISPPAPAGVFSIMP